MLLFLISPNEDHSEDDHLESYTENDYLISNFSSEIIHEL